MSSDHWNTIEDALREKRIKARRRDYRRGQKGVETAPIDAALAFVREMRQGVQPDWSQAPTWANYACLQQYNSNIGPFFRWLYFEHEPTWGELNYNRAKGKWGNGSYEEPSIPLSAFVDLRATLQQRPQPKEGDA